MDKARSVVDSSNSSMSLPMPPAVQPRVQEGFAPQLKSANRGQGGAEAGLPSAGPTSIRERVLAHLQDPTQDNRPELRIPVDALAEYAALLQSLPPSEFVGTGPSRRALQISIYHRQGDTAKHLLDLGCLAPLAEKDEGVFLDSLKVEISLRNAHVKGLLGLMKHGRSLRRLSLMFVHSVSKPKVQVAQYLMSCLARRQSPLANLALFNFGKALSSEVLGALLGQGLPVRTLALGMGESSDALPGNFRIEDLLAGGLHALQLRGLTLCPSNLDRLGLRMHSFALKELQLERCILKGNSEPLFCGLLASQSLHSLRFVQNVVEHANVTPDRLLRLLHNLPSLRNLRIEEFDNDAFRKQLADLKKTCPQLDIKFRDDDQPSLAPPRLRKGWRSERESDSPTTMATPLIESDPDSASAQGQDDL